MPNPSLSGSDREAVSAARGARPLPRVGGAEKIAEHFEPDPRYLIPILQFIQSEAGFLSPEAMQSAARYLRIPESKVYGVASFYAQFRFEPRGKHTVTICRGTACHVRGSRVLLREIEKELGVEAGGTSGDMLFTLETVACFGSCALAPVVVVDGRVYGRQTAASLKKLVGGLRAGARGKRPSRARRGRRSRRKRP
jgi:NADH-quinone oxidoreductase subunit E